MIQLIKADLIGILTLFAEYRPELSKNSLKPDLDRLRRCEDRDYFFLARREKSYLFSVDEAYSAGSFENLCWTGCLGKPEPHTDALYIHISRIKNGTPFGCITVLDYASSARDADISAYLPKDELEAHIKRTLWHYRYSARVCSTMEFIQFIKGR